MTRHPTGYGAAWLVPLAGALALIGFELAQHGGAARPLAAPPARSAPAPSSSVPVVVLPPPHPSATSRPGGTVEPVVAATAAPAPAPDAPSPLASLLGAGPHPRPTPTPPPSPRVPLAVVSLTVVAPSARSSGLVVVRAAVVIPGAPPWLPVVGLDAVLRVR